MLNKVHSLLTERSIYRERNNTTWTDVVNMRAEQAVREYPDCNVIFYLMGGSYLWTFLAKFRGRKVIVVGKGADGWYLLYQIWIISI